MSSGDTTPTRLTWIANAIPYVCGVAIFLVLLFFGRSKGTVDNLELPGLGNAKLEVQSTDGMLIVGVYEERPGVWWRPRRTALASLNTNALFGFAADPWGWALALPHLFVVLLLLIPVAWWAFAFRSRREETHRIEHGLCENCGYDVTFSDYRCPECGEPHGNLRWNDQPLPPPPLAHN